MEVNITFFLAAFEVFQIPVFSVPANFCFFNCCNARKGEVCPSGKVQHKYTNLFESQGLTGLSLVWILMSSNFSSGFFFPFLSYDYIHILNLMIFNFIDKALQKGISKPHSFVLEKKIVSALCGYTRSLESPIRESSI